MLPKSVHLLSRPTLLFYGSISSHSGCWENLVTFCKQYVYKELHTLDWPVQAYSTLQKSAFVVCFTSFCNHRSSGRTYGLLVCRLSLAFMCSFMLISSDGFCNRFQSGPQPQMRIQPLSRSLVQEAVLTVG